MSERAKWVVAVVVGLALGVALGLAAAKRWPVEAPKHEFEHVMNRPTGDIKQRNITC